MPPNRPKPEEKKQYVVVEKDTGKFVRDGHGRGSDFSDMWNWMGITAPDIFKGIIQFTAAVVFVTIWYIDDMKFKDFIATQTIINTHTAECSDNRDKWASLKNGHIFECGKPIDGWTPNRGNVNEKTN